VWFQGPRRAHPFSPVGAWCTRPPVVGPPRRAAGRGAGARGGRGGGGAGPWPWPRAVDGIPTTLRHLGRGGCRLTTRARRWGARARVHGDAVARGSAAVECLAGGGSTGQRCGLAPSIMPRSLYELVSLSIESLGRHCGPERTVPPVGETRHRGDDGQGQAAHPESGRKHTATPHSAAERRHATVLQFRTEHGARAATPPPPTTLSLYPRRLPPVFPPMPLCSTEGCRRRHQGRATGAAVAARSGGTTRPGAPSVPSESRPWHDLT